MRRLLPLLLLALLASCGKAELPGKPVDDSPAGRFFAALTDDLARAGERTVPGSAAARYVDFQVQLEQARADADVALVDTSVRRSADGYLLCEKDPSPPRCAQVTDVVLDGDKVRTFEVDGEPIRDRLGRGGRAIGAGAVGTVQVVAAYEQPSTRELWVLVRVTAGAHNVSVHLADGVYTRAGKGTKVLQAGELDVVPASGKALLAAVVPGGKLGGTLRLAFVVQGEKVFAEVPVRR